MYYDINNAIKYIANYEYPFFFNKPNVIGIGLGYKIINKITTDIKCIKVFVSKKLSINMLNINDLIPLIYKGFLTDVVETDMGKASSLRNKVRPVTGGYDIGSTFSKDISGTYGCLVIDDINYYMLSCNHVIAAVNEAPINTPILQPSIAYGGQSPIDIVAKLSKFIPLKFKTPTETPENFVDCAIAKVENLSLVSNIITFIGPPTGTRKPSLNLSVEKIGAVTEHSLGTILDINATMLLDYKSGREILFKNLILTNKMTLPGDSGSILLDFNAKAVGLFIADSNDYSMFTPIDDVLTALNVTLA